MFQNGQRVCFKNGGDPARIQKVQLAYGKDRSRAPQVIPTTDTNATQVQVVTSEDAARYPFIDPIGLIGAPAAWFRADTGVTVTGLGASTWADQSGNGRDLLQTTDASRPPYLSYSASSGKYLYCPGANGNYASTPDSAAASLSDVVDIRCKARLADWTPAANALFIGQYDASAIANESYGLFMDSGSTGKLMFAHIASTGPTRTFVTSTASAAITDGEDSWVRVTWAKSTGATNFYKSSDGVTWTQVGTADVAGPTTSIQNIGVTISVGGSHDGSTYLVNGRIYRASIYSTIGGTTPVVDFNPDLDGSDQAATITSSATGEVWTINSSGGLPAQIVARPSLLFDGSADYLKCNAFTLNQPETVYIAFKQVSWTDLDYAFDGNAAASGALTQGGATPTLKIAASSAVADNGNLAIGDYGVGCALFNGASSLFQINNTAATTGSAGVLNMGGFTLGARADAARPGNIQVLEVIIAASAHDASTRARVIQYLAGRHGIAL